MKKLLKLLFLTIGFSVTAQNSITGTITNTNNEPITGVEIFASDLHIGTTSKNDGTYTLKNVPNGKMTLIFNYLGYKTISKTIDISSKNEIIDVVLEESPFEMDEIIVSTSFNKLQSENVMKVDLLTAKSFQKMGVTTLVEGISNIAGVSQISTGTSIGKPVIRGLSGNRVLVYTQGIRLENQQFGGEHGLGINDAGIYSVEVIKGPASLLYGSDALGGVLYINPEKFAPQNNEKINVNQKYFSNTLGSNTSVGFKKSYENWRFLARGTYGVHSDYKIPTDQRVTNTRFAEKDLKTGVSYSKNNFSTTVRYNFNNSKLGLTEGVATQSTSTDLLEPYQLINNHILSSHSHFFFEKSKLDIDLGYTFNDRQEFEEHDEHDEHEDEEGHEEEEEHHKDEDPALQMKLKTFSYNVKYHFPKVGNFEVLSGVQGLNQKNKNFGEEILIPNANVNDFGIFTTSNYRWKNNALQFGIRFDSRKIATEKHEIVHEDEVHIFQPIDKSFTSFTTSLGLKTNLTQFFTSRVNFSTGFRAPNLAELASNGVHHGTNRFEQGNANLNNEKNSQIDISLEYKTDHFEFFVNGFYNNLNDYIFLSPTGEIEDSAPVFTYLQENATLRGGEIGLHFHPHPLDWLHFESSFETVVGKQNNGNYLPLIPANSLKNTIRTEFKISDWLQQGYSSLSLQNVFSQENVSLFETNTVGYNLVNLAIGGKLNFGKLTFNSSISVNNLFDEKYINHLSRLKSDGIYNTGRNIVLGVNFIF